MRRSISRSSIETLAFEAKRVNWLNMQNPDRSDEILQRRWAFADLLFELLVVAVDRVVLLLFQFDELLVQPNDRALLQEIAVRAVGRPLSLLFVNDPKFSEINGSRNSRHASLRAVE